MARSRNQPPIIVWFRDDLRVADNPALAEAAATGRPILPLYLLDDESPGIRPIGGASRWWLHGSLAALADELRKLGAELLLRRGSATVEVPGLVSEVGADAVYWNRRYVPEQRHLDDAVEEELEHRGVGVRTFAGALGREPGEISPKGGGWFHVFAPYWRAHEAAGLLPEPRSAPKRLKAAPVAAGVPLEALNLLPKHPDWAGGLAETLVPGEAEAQRKLAGFVGSGLADYATRRTMPASDGSSQLSAHLRFGEVSPRQVVHAVLAAARTAADRERAQKFLQEVTWRDFSYSLLAHVPDLPRRPFSPRFTDFPWRTPTPRLLRAWQMGQTGYPIVDAGMRQLWQTGWMHNRVRMITASFLVKDLLLDWPLGEAWFWDTLCDADPANNAVNWQWVAGTGPDAAPFFRIFNPVLQGEKFDPEGTYVRRFVPELSELPTRFTHKPWEASRAVLAAAGIELGRTYPRPIVDHGEARDRALAAFRGSRPTRE